MKTKKKKNEKSKGRFIQNPNCDIPSLPLHTSERTVLIERKALSHLLNPKWLGRGKVAFFFRVLLGTDPVETGWGL